MTGELGESKVGDEAEPPVTFEEFCVTMQGWQEKPWNDDEGLAALAKTFGNILPPNIHSIFENDISEIYENLDESGALSPEHEFVVLVYNYVCGQEHWFVDTLTSVNASYKGRKLYHALRYVIFMMRNERVMNRYFDDQGVERPKLEHSYPEDFDQPEAFHELINVIMTNDGLVDLLIWALERFRIRTTVIPRYVIARAELRRVFGDQPIRLGSVGVGSGHGEKALVANIDFEDVEVVKHGLPGVEPEVDIEATRQYNEQKNAPLNIVKLYGFDIYGIRDEPQKTWIEASLLMREHKNAKLMETYKRLDQVTYERANFHTLDITDDEAVERFLLSYQCEHGGIPTRKDVDDFIRSFEEKNGRTPNDYEQIDFFTKYARDNGQMPNFDAFLAITVFYQFKDATEREKAYKNIAKFVKPGGFILVQDSVDGSFEGDFNYEAYKFYPHEPERKPELVARCRDDRCHQIIIPSEPG